MYMRSARLVMTSLPSRDNIATSVDNIHTASMASSPTEGSPTTSLIAALTDSLTQSRTASLDNSLTASLAIAPTVYPTASLAGERKWRTLFHTQHRIGLFKVLIQLLSPFCTSLHTREWKAVGPKKWKKKKTRRTVTCIFFNAQNKYFSNQKWCIIEQLKERWCKHLLSKKGKHFKTT